MEQGQVTGVESEYLRNDRRNKKDGTRAKGIFLKTFHGCD